MPRQWLLGSKFDEVYPHLSGVKALWETKWKFPCQKSVYPFHHGSYSDFEPIFAALIRDGINDAYSREYTEHFLPTARKLVDEAISCQNSDRKKAIELFERAACVFRISRFPSVDGDEDGFKRGIFDEQVAVYLRGASLWDVPLTQVIVSHVHAAGSDGKDIPVFLRVPKGASQEKPCPVVLLLTGLDGHRPDNTGRSDEFLRRGWASVIVEIPGTADCPVDRRDPKSPDRLWSSVLDWIDQQPSLDSKRVVTWGLSAGGYYAIRLAHTHHDRLIGAIGQGAGVHDFLGKEWLSKVDNHEYPFTLSHAYVKKYGYKDWDELKEKAQEDFSLLHSGLLDGPSCRLLLVNGIWDGLMPIEDSMMLMNYGRPKEARFYPERLHMGYPEANGSVWPWMEEVMHVSNNRV